MTTEERLEKVERELDRVKRGNRRLVLAGTGLLLGLLALLVVGRSMTNIAQGQEKAADKTVIRANKFILEDDDGKIRGSLAVDQNGPALYLFDDSGRQCAGLTVSNRGPILFLCDENGRSRALLNVLSPGGPQLSLSDENGQVRTMLGTGGVSSWDGKEIIYCVSSLRLYGPDGKVMWQTPEPPKDRP